MYIYVSQEEVFSDFNNTEALFWFHRDLVYGDWGTGENGDGCYEHYKEMDIPEVHTGFHSGRPKDVMHDIPLVALSVLEPALFFVIILFWRNIVFAVLATIFTIFRKSLNQVQF